jgi:D-alanyl-D-alanine carboxypeptidase
MKKARIITALVLIAVICLASACGSDEEGSATDDETDGKGQNAQSAGSFASVYYYEADRADRYEAYAAANPGLSVEDVVWMVDVDLDKEEYEDTSVSRAPDSLTALVTKHFSLPDDYEPDDLVDIDATKLREEAAVALESMKKAMADEDLTIVAQSGYRSFARQRELYEGYRNGDPEGADTYSSRPGFSEHQTGTTIDVNIALVGNRDFVGTPEADWVAKNGYRYGFIVRYIPEVEAYTGYESEPWHLRYIGIENATRMHDEGIACFEEYWVKFVTHVKDLDK